jgi:glucosylceramidase
MKELKCISILILTVYLFLGASFSCIKKSNSDSDKSDSLSHISEKTKINYWLTTSDKSAMLDKQAPFYFESTMGFDPVITVDENETYQTIDGFGFSFTGSSAWLINKMEKSERDALMKELFGWDSTSLSISYIRISIGASDLSPTVYSYCDSENDFSLSTFSLGFDKTELVPLLKQALQLNPKLKIMGSPWSAPFWMKSNKNSVGGSLKTEYYELYAQYIVKYLNLMKAEGILIDAITPQNEPLHGGNNPSMLMTSAEQAYFIKKHLGPAFKAAGISTKIVIYDHNCDKPEYPLSILNDPEAATFVDGSAFHLYGGDISVLSQVHNAYPSKNIYFTEQWVGGPGNFNGDLQWHIKNLIIGASRNWSRIVLEWNIASDPFYDPHTPGGCDRCEGALTIGNSIQRNVSYYIIGHASRFIPSGSVRIGSNELPQLSNVAFKTPDGRKVLILLNENPKEQLFQVGFKGKYARLLIKAGAVATLVWK